MNKQAMAEVWGFRACPTTAGASEPSTARLQMSATITYAEMLQRISDHPSAPEPREVAEV